MVSTADAKGVEALPVDSAYAQEIDRLKKQIEIDKTGPKIIRAKDIPWRVNQQSILKNYIRSLHKEHPAIDRWTGVEHQHFNLEDKPSRWVAMENRKVADLVGAFMEQKENNP